MSRGRTTQCFLWLRETRRYRNGVSRSCKGAACLQWRQAAREKKEKGREEEEEEDSRERQVRYEIAHEVVAGTKEKASAHEDAKTTAQGTVGQSVKQKWDCLQTEKTKKRRKRTGKRRTRWKRKGPRMRG